ncbi:hypothetical protein GCM10017744_067260 [Streptomyces antimycoticus]|uniref:Uncharacterized protein n=1 Tax=Streptomyces antimycoticus TaxID=68175 RepID=A0A4D4K7E7_9ACTN|nr:hypothetical protein SANT12839_034700 [Streptomyces antimycoticus]
MVGRATLTMKKSISGSAAPSSTVNNPRGLSAGPEEVWVRAVVFPPVVFVPVVFPVVFAASGAAFLVRIVEICVSVTLTKILGRSSWYQSVFILVQEVPGNRLSPSGTLEP